MKAKHTIFILVVAIILITTITFAGDWMYNRYASVGKGELIGIISAKGAYTTIELHRVIDWQTGNVIYIATETRRSSTSPTIAVVPLRTN